MNVVGTYFHQNSVSASFLYRKFCNFCARWHLFSLSKNFRLCSPLLTKSSAIFVPVVTFFHSAKNFASVRLCSLKVLWFLCPLAPIFTQRKIPPLFASAHKKFCDFCACWHLFSLSEKFHLCSPLLTKSFVIFVPVGTYFHSAKISASVPLCSRKVLQFLCPLAPIFTQRKFLPQFPSAHKKFWDFCARWHLFSLRENFRLCYEIWIWIWMNMNMNMNMKLTAKY